MLTPRPAMYAGIKASAMMAVEMTIIVDVEPAKLPTLHYVPLAGIDKKLLMEINNERLSD
jgi:hypothetical protein